MFIVMSINFYYKSIVCFYFRSLNKQIKDKNEHRDKLTDDLKRDGERQHELEQQIQVLCNYFLLCLQYCFIKLSLQKLISNFDSKFRIINSKMLG